VLLTTNIIVDIAVHVCVRAENLPPLRHLSIKLFIQQNISASSANILLSRMVNDQRKTTIDSFGTATAPHLRLEQEKT
jgi:hypothetical protein